MKFIEFGRVIPGLKIRGKDVSYPVLNKRDGRAAAGSMFALAGVAFALAFLLKDHYLINFVVSAGVYF